MLKRSKKFTPAPTPLNLPEGETFPHPSLDGELEMLFLMEEKMPGYITANAATYKFIKEMRSVLKENPTKAEKVIWEYLRTKKTGHKIRRQHIVGNFITDFICLRKKVVIEIDGKIHEKQKEYDALRTAFLNDWGYEVIRFTNEEVFANPESVANQIKIHLDAKADAI